MPRIFFIRSAHRDLEDVKKYQAKDVISKCDIKYELANVSAVNFK